MFLLFCSVYGCMLCLVRYIFVISTSVIDCLGRFVPEMTYYVSSGTLNLTKPNLLTYFCRNESGRIWNPYTDRDQDSRTGLLLKCNQDFLVQRCICGEVFFRSVFFRTYEPNCAENVLYCNIKESHSASEVTTLRRHWKCYYYY